MDYKKKFNDDMYTGSVYHAYTMLSEAFVKAKSTDPVKVAAVMEGMKFNSFNGEVEMRKTDHQLQQGLFISKWEKAGGKYPIDSENTGHTFVPVKYYEPYVASTPTSCQMKRLLSFGRVGFEARRTRAFFLPSIRRIPMNLEFFVISLLNGVSYGLLLFMLSSGLTLDLQH